MNGFFWRKSLYSIAEQRPMPANIINLKSMRERRKVISKHCRALGLNPVFFRGIESSALPNIISDIPPRSKPAQLGCLASHLLLLRRLSGRKGASAYLVLEDDCILHPDFIDAICHAIKHIPPKVELLQIGTSNPNFIGKQIEQFRDGIPCTRWVRMHWGAYAYLITNSAAKRISARFVNALGEIDIRGLHMPDHVVSDSVLYSSAVSYSLTYPLAMPAPTPSSIGYGPAAIDAITRGAQMVERLWSESSPFADYIKLSRFTIR